MNADQQATGVETVAELMAKIGRLEAFAWYHNHQGVSEAHADVEKSLTTLVTRCDRLEAEVAAQRPVVEAAVTFTMKGTFDALAAIRDAVGAYLTDAATAPPDDPVHPPHNSAH